MLIKSLKKISFVGAGNILNVLIGFVYLTAVARKLDLETFGKYALLTTLLLTISKIVDFGANSVFVAKAISNTKNEKQLSQTLYSLRVLQFLVTIPISIIFLKIFNLLTPAITLIFILGILAYAMNYLFYAYFQKAEMYTEMIILNTLGQVIKGVYASLFLLNIIEPSLNLSFGVFSLSIFAGIFLYVRIPVELKNFKFDLTSVKDLFKESYPAGISQLIAESWSTISNGVAKFTSGFSDVGVLSVASKISNIFNLVALSIFAVLLPKNAQLKKKKVGYDFLETGIIAAAVMLMAVAATFVARLFVVQIFGEKFENSLGLLDILIYAAAIASIHSFLENFFFIEGKTNYIIAASFGKLTAYILAAIVLVPVMSLYGIAWANIVSSVAGLGIAIYFIWKFKKVNA